MDNDFVDVFPSAGGVGDSPVKTTASEGHLNQGSSSRPGLSLSIPDTGGREALVSPAIPGSRGVSVASMAKESALRSARPVSGASTPAAREEDVVMSLDTPSESPAAVGGGGLMMPLTIDPGGECMPTELENKRAKLEKYKYECSEVADSFLYVSGEDAAKQQGLVGSKGITHIINCAGPQCPNYLEYTGRFNFLRLNFYDHRTEDCAWFMYKAFDFIKAAEQQRGRVLVHCVQGVSRSCTLAIAWLMLTEGVDYDEAYLRVRHGRPICAPNTGFICSLLEWQRRRQQPPPSPLLYRTAWHVPLFPNDLVLKICLHEDDRQHVLPTLAALDSRGCYLLVVPRRRREKNGSGGGPSRTPGIGAAGSSSRTSRATFSTNPSRTSNFALPVVPGGIQTPVANGNGKRINVAGGSGGSGSGGSDSPAPPVSRAALGRLSTPSPAAARAKAAAAAAVIANAKAVAAVAAAKEAQAVAAAAAAEEAVMVAKAVEAGVAVPWTWRESEVSSRGAPKARLSSGASPPQAAGAARHMVVSDSPTAAVRPSSAPGPRLRPIGVGAGDVEEEEEEGGVDVYVWRGTQSNERMLELAKEGAGWLHDYEGWGVGSSAPVVEEGQETPQVLRHLQSAGDNPREPPVYGDLSSPSPPPTAARTGSSAFMPCPTPSHHGGGGMGRSAPMLSPAETPTLSPAGPSPSPGGVSFSPYGCGVSPAGSTLFGSGQGGAGATISPSGSTAVSPAPSHHKLSIGSGYGAAMGSGYGSGYNPPRCSMASATEEMDEDEEEEEEEEDEHEERVAMGLSPLGEARPAALGAPESGGGGRGGGDIPKLYELADELGGQGTSGLRWSHLAIFDDQDLLPQCCFLLVTPGKQSFLWVGEAFAAGLVQAVSTLQQLQALAKDVAVRDARRKSDRQLPRPSDVETALLVLGDGSEPPEWWSAFESGYT